MLWQHKPRPGPCSQAWPAAGAGGLALTSRSVAAPSQQFPRAPLVTKEELALRPTGQLSLSALRLSAWSPQERLQRRQSDKEAGGRVAREEDAARSRRTHGGDLRAAGGAVEGTQSSPSPEGPSRGPRC